MLFNWLSVKDGQGHRNGLSHNEWGWGILRINEYSKSMAEENKGFAESLCEAIQKRLVKLRKKYIHFQDIDDLCQYAALIMWEEKNSEIPYRFLMADYFRETFGDIRNKCNQRTLIEFKEVYSAYDFESQAIRRLDALKKIRWEKERVAKSTLSKRDKNICMMYLSGQLLDDIANKHSLNKYRVARILADNGYKYY
jgi:hypothetical protein